MEMGGSMNSPQPPIAGDPSGGGGGGVISSTTFANHPSQQPPLSEQYYIINNGNQDHSGGGGVNYGSGVRPSTPTALAHANSCAATNSNQATPATNRSTPSREDVMSSFGLSSMMGNQSGLGNGSGGSSNGPGGAYEGGGVGGSPYSTGGGGPSASGNGLLGGNALNGQQAGGVSRIINMDMELSYLAPSLLTQSNSTSSPSTPLSQSQSQSQSQSRSSSSNALNYSLYPSPPLALPLQSSSGTNSTTSSFSLTPSLSSNSSSSSINTNSAQRHHPYAHPTHPVHSSRPVIPLLAHAQSASAVPVYFNAMAGSPGGPGLDGGISSAPSTPQATMPMEFGGPLSNGNGNGNGNGIGNGVAGGHAGGPSPSQSSTASPPPPRLAHRVHSAPSHMMSQLSTNGLQTQQPDLMSAKELMNEQRIFLLAAGSGNEMEGAGNGLDRLVAGGGEWETQLRQQQPPPIPLPSANSSVAAALSDSGGYFDNVLPPTAQAPTSAPLISNTNFSLSRGPPSSLVITPLPTSSSTNTSIVSPTTSGALDSPGPAIALLRNRLPILEAALCATAGESGNDEEEIWKGVEGAYEELKRVMGRRKDSRRASAPGMALRQLSFSSAMDLESNAASDRDRPLSASQFLSSQIHPPLLHSQSTPDVPLSTLANVARAQAQVQASQIQLQQAQLQQAQVQQAQLQQAQLQQAQLQQAQLEARNRLAQAHADEESQRILLAESMERERERERDRERENLETQVRLENLQREQQYEHALQLQQAQLIRHAQQQQAQLAAVQAAAHAQERAQDLFNQNQERAAQAQVQAQAQAQAQAAQLQNQAQGQQYSPALTSSYPGSIILPHMTHNPSPLSLTTIPGQEHHQQPPPSHSLDPSIVLSPNSTNSLPTQSLRSQPYPMPVSSFASPQQPSSSSTIDPSRPTSPRITNSVSTEYQLMTASVSEMGAVMQMHMGETMGSNQDEFADLRGGTMMDSSQKSSGTVKGLERALGHSNDGMEGVLQQVWVGASGGLELGNEQNLAPLENGNGSSTTATRGLGVEMEDDYRLHAHSTSEQQQLDESMLPTSPPAAIPATNNFGSNPSTSSSSSQPTPLPSPPISTSQSIANAFAPLQQQSIRPSRSRAASGSVHATTSGSRSRAASGSGYQSVFETRSRAQSSASSVFGTYERDDEDELEDGDAEQSGSKNSFGASTGSGIDAATRAAMDDVFLEFLADLCSNLDATDSKGEAIHQTLMPKKMERLDQSQDFRPFKFRIQAFTTAFSEMLALKGFAENDVPVKRIRAYLWTQPCVSRFNDDGKKAKSKGNHIWTIEAKKVPGKKWVFREFTRCIKGPPLPVASVGLPWSWAPRVWDPQISAASINATFSSPALPSWLSWGDNVLEGEPPESAKGIPLEIEVVATFVLNSKPQQLSTTISLMVVSPDDEDESNQGRGMEREYSVEDSDVLSPMPSNPGTPFRSPLQHERPLFADAPFDNASTSTYIAPHDLSVDPDHQMQVELNDHVHAHAHSEMLQRVMQQQQFQQIQQQQHYDTDSQMHLESYQSELESQSAVHQRYSALVTLDSPFNNVASSPGPHSFAPPPELVAVSRQLAEYERNLGDARSFPGHGDAQALTFDERGTPNLPLSSPYHSDLQVAPGGAFVLAPPPPPPGTVDPSNL